MDLKVRDLRFLRSLVTAALLLGVAAGLSAAEIYKWVDAAGVVHFSSNPPDNVQAEVIRPGISATSRRSAPSQDSRDRSDRADQDAVAEASLTQAQPEPEPREPSAEEIAAACERSREIVAQVEPRIRVTITEADGSQRRLDDNERLALLNENKTFIEQNC